MVQAEKYKNQNNHMLPFDMLAKLPLVLPMERPELRALSYIGFPEQEREVILPSSNQANPYAAC